MFYTNSIENCLQNWYNLIEYMKVPHKIQVSNDRQVNNMDTQLDILEILDTAVKDISKKVAKLDMLNTDSAEINTEGSSSLVTTTNGDYALTIIFYTEEPVLRAITENMKRGQAANAEDIPIYTTEYFNILCGHIITNMNKKSHTSARFGVPRMVKGQCNEETQSELHDKQELFYNCSYGPIKVKTLYKRCS